MTDAEAAEALRQLKKQIIERITNMRPKGPSPDGYVINDTLNRVETMIENVFHVVTKS